MNVLTRRRFLGAAGATLIALPTLAACGSGQPSGAPTSGAAARDLAAQLVWLKNVEYGGFWLADSKQLYRDSQLAVKFLAGGPNLPNAGAVLAGGAADLVIGEQLQTMVEGVNKGQDFVALGAVFQTSPSGILSLPAKPIKTAQDIVGKRIGVQQGAKPFIDAILSVNKLPKEYTAVPVGFDPTPLTEGAVDGYVCFLTNQPLTLKARNIPYQAVPYGDLGLPSYAGMIFTTRKYLDANRPALVQFMKATRQGWTDYLTAPDQAAELAVSTYGADLGLNVDQQKLQAQAQLPLIQSDDTEANGLLWMSTERIAGAIYTGLKAAGVDPLPDPQTLVDLTVLQDAAKS